MRCFDPGVAEAMAGRWDYSAWLTVICAPSNFLETNSEQVQMFDKTLTYEDLALQLPEFAVTN